MTRKIILCAVFTACFSLHPRSFSPYENYLLSGRQTHVALFAAARDGKSSELAAALRTLNQAKTLEAFKQVDITNLSTYAKELQGKTW